MRAGGDLPGHALRGQRFAQAHGRGVQLLRMIAVQDDQQVVGQRQLPRGGDEIARGRQEEGQVNDLAHST